MWISTLWNIFAFNYYVTFKTLRGYQSVCNSKHPGLYCLNTSDYYLIGGMSVACLLFIIGVFHKLTPNLNREEPQIELKRIEIRR